MHYLKITETVKKNILLRNNLIKEYRYLFTPMGNKRYLKIVKYTRNKKHTDYYVDGVVVLPDKYSDNYLYLLDTSITKTDLMFHGEIDSEEYRRYANTNRDIIIDQNIYTFSKTNVSVPLCTFNTISGFPKRVLCPYLYIPDTIIPYLSEFKRSIIESDKPLHYELSILKETK